MYLEVLQNWLPVVFYAEWFDWTVLVEDRTKGRHSEVGELKVDMVKRGTKKSINFNSKYKFLQNIFSFTGKIPFIKRWNIFLCLGSMCQNMYVSIIISKVHGLFSPNIEKLSSSYCKGLLSFGHLKYPIDYWYGALMPWVRQNWMTG